MENSSLTRAHSSAEDFFGDLDTVGVAEPIWCRDRGTTDARSAAPARIERAAHTVVLIEQSSVRTQDI